MKLIETADVVLNNFRPDVMGKLGLSYDEVSKLEPTHHLRERQRLGADGTVRLPGGQDLLAQALSGMMDLQARPGGAPPR